VGWPFVRTLIVRDVLGSTSDLARELAVAGRVETPFAVRAMRQTSGRGRGAHRWWSDAGSLTFTIVLDPAAHGLRREHEPRLALCSAVAVVDAIVQDVPGIAPGIRWPNDIEAAGRKIGGILPERLETPRGPRLLVGIGLNVETRMDDAPPDVRRMAASLADLRPSTTPGRDLEPLLLAILERFAGVVDRLARDDPSLAARWQALDTLRDRTIRVNFGPSIVTGVARGIDPDGALCLDTDEGATRLFGGQVLRDP
jgi:BirA family biotin operon repressor/biotin-[acetyl-CoA-carboxylase] ligase